MKKIYFCALQILTACSLYGLPIGNPSEASILPYDPASFSGWDGICQPCFCWWEALNYRMGYYGDFVFDRNLEVRNDALDSFAHEGASITTNAGYFVLNFCHRVDIFSTLGSTSFHLRQDQILFGAPTSLESEIAFRPAFSWSIGARATLWDCYPISLGIEGQWFSSSPRPDYFLDYATGDKLYFDGTNVSYHEWQIGIGLSYRMATQFPEYAFIPYGGIKYSHVCFNLEELPVPGTALVLTDFESKKHWGASIGLTFTMFSRAAVTVEATFGDEEAFYLNGQLKF